MTEKKRKTIVYAIFVLAVLWGLYMQPWKSNRQSEIPDTYAETVPASVASTPIGAAMQRVILDVPDAGWVIDPFRPTNNSAPETAPVTDDGPLGELVLQGTLVVDGSQLCVINGHRLHTGDEISGWRIVQIADGEVKLAGFGNESLTLRSRRIDRERSSDPS
jgi:hypothetical protein